MRSDQWWKNFGMGLEVDAAGSFIYNAIHHLHVIDNLSHSIDSFEILYGLSVGIERLQKVAIVLLEHSEDRSIDELEKSLISHNTMELSNRIDKSCEQGLSGVHKELLSLLSKFYKTHRYGRYSPSSVPEIEMEKVLFLEYLSKHLRIDISGNKMLFGIPNTEQIRLFVGKVVKKITDGLYKIISSKASELNLYTYELRCDSKAMKVFLGERLDFLDEDKIRREMLLYLISDRADSDHLDLLRDYESLELDPGLDPAYIKALITDSSENMGYIADGIKAHYDDLDNLKERFDFLSIMDNEYLSYDEE